VRLAALTLLLCCLQVAKADPLTLAVASNFVPTAEAIAADFTEETGLDVRISSGSTGKLHAQIMHGAPYDILLAADSNSPQQVEESGLGVTGSRFTYALGLLVLWSSAAAATECSLTLQDLGDARLAIANPVTAPYGRAAKEFLELTGSWERMSAQIVYGENVAQALHFAVTSNARYAIVAKSQSLDPRLADASCARRIPEETYSRIEQQAVLLQRAAENPAAQAFMQFLQSSDARDTMRRMGYGLQ
jgi:molybdate transport system substrate-binding protein